MEDKSLDGTAWNWCPDVTKVLRKKEFNSNGWVETRRTTLWRCTRELFSCWWEQDTQIANCVVRCKNSTVHLPWSNTQSVHNIYTMYSLMQYTFPGPVYTVYSLDHCTRLLPWREGQVATSGTEIHYLQGEVQKCSSGRCTCHKQDPAGVDGGKPTRPP